MPQFECSVSSCRRLVACLALVTFFLVKLGATLPGPWENADVGTVGSAGTADYDSSTGTYTLQGSGADIGGTADNFHFAYRPLSGDGYIVARVASLTNTNASAKAGVMIRESLDANAKNALMMVTPGAGVGIKWRTSTGGSASQVLVAGVQAPRWVKLERRDKMVTGYESADGVTWTVVQRVALSMTADVYVGLVACSRTSGLTTMTADQVLIDAPEAGLALPWPWTEHSVGAPADAGVALYDGSYVLSNLGADITGTADKMKYVSQTLIGDGTLVVKVASVSSADNSTRFGLMMRDGLAANARSVLLGLTTSKSVVFMSRRTTAGTLTSRATNVTVAVPAWLCLSRAGNVFTAWRSVDGVNWTEHGSETLELGPVLEVGLAYSNRSASTWAIGVGDELKLTTPADLDGNGLPDAWETLYFGTTGVDPLADTDADGLTHHQEWELGNDPLVFNQEGQRPLLQVQSGNHQSGPVGTLLPQVLAVRVTDSLSADPLANVPVQLRVSRGDGTLGSTAPGATSLSLLSDANGLVQSPFLLPLVGGLNLVDASVGGGSQAAAVTFSLNARVGEEPLLFDLSDLGSPAAPARAVYSSGDYTLSGATIADNAGASDQSAFLWRDLTGDGYILARVNLLDATNAYAQVGLMARDGLASDAPNAALLLTLSQGIAFQSRDTPAATTAVYRKTGVYGPVWLLLRRQGDVFNGLYSTDGVTWKLHGSRTIAMGETVKVGLTLGTRSTVLQSATADGLRLGAFSESPWSAVDIGLPRASAVNDYAENSVFVRGGGGDMAGNADAFHYVYQPLPGDGRLTARVASQLAVKTTTKSALMIRESLEPGARHVALTLMPSNGLTLRRREQTNGSTATSSAVAATAPHWLRIDRLGPNIVASASPDGETWTSVGSVVFDPGATPLIGLAASSNDTANHTQTLFDHLSLEMGEGTLGWNGAYYEGTEFNQSRAFRRDVALDFTWAADQAPAPGVPASAYSIRWQGDVVPGHSETYTFTTLSQGSVRVLVNDQVVIDRWTPHALDETTGTVALQAGQPVRVVVEYADAATGDSRIRLNWSSSSQPDEAVPFTSVRAIDSDDDGMPDAWELAHGLNPNHAADAALDSDTDGLTNLHEYQLGGNPHAADDRLPGAALMETWTGIGGIIVRDLTKDARFHGAPNLRGNLTTLDAPLNSGNSYGRRIRGYLVPPVTGDYRFHVSANDSAELWLAPDDSPFTRVKVARVGQGATLHHQFDARAEQHSPLIPLQAGQLYYFEALHKENGTDDHLTIAWTPPGATSHEVISGQALALFTGHADDLDDNGLPDLWEAAEGLTDPLLIATARGSYGDADTDRLPNLLEYQHGLNPLVPDTDGDTYEDMLEVVVQSDPLTTSDLNLAPWQLGDVGPVTTPALANRVGTGSFLLADTGTGAAMHKEDNFCFLHRQISGDFELTARIARPESNAIGLAGVSVRSGLNSKAISLTMLQAVSGLNSPFVRTSEDGAIVPLPAFTPAFASEAASLSGYWFRVRREGALVSLFYSADGRRWILSNAKTLALGESCLVGFAICHNMGPFTSIPDVDVPVRLIKDISLITDLTPAETSETVPADATVTPVATINGNAGVVVNGQWSTDADGTGIVSQTFTGKLDYTFTVPADGLYRLTFTALSSANLTTSTLFPVEISVDGQFVARVNLILSIGEDGLAQVIAPWLTAGTHTVRLFYDNTLSYRPLRIRSLAVEQLGGADANGNGVADWIDDRLAYQNTIDTDTQLYVSPASLHGKARYRSLFTLTTDGQAVTTNPAPGFGWYADVPLGETSPVEVTGDFENSGSVQSVLLTWSPLNLLEIPEEYAVDRHMRVRLGDSLRFTVLDPESNTGGSATLSITAPDATVGEHALNIPNPHAQAGSANGKGNNGDSNGNQAALPLVQAFSQPGVYTVTGTFIEPNGTVHTAAPFTVEVVEAAFSSDPVVGLNNTPVTWDTPLIFDDVLLEVDQGLLLWKTGTLPAGGTRFAVSTSNTADSYIIARLGENGPIFGHATVRSIRVATISDTAMDLLQVYPDGSKLIGVPIIVSPLTDDTRVEVEIFVQGVTFDDGTIVKVLTKADFDEYGRIYLKFIYPAGVPGSICHRVHVYEGDTYLGQF